MSPGGEVPKPKAPAGAKGVFTATVTESGSTRTISWKLTFSGLSGKAVGGAYPQGQGRCRRRRDRPALWPVQERSDREAEGVEGHRRRARAGRRVRERPHGEERCRRDSRADQAAEPRHVDDPDARPGHDDDVRPPGYGGPPPATRPVEDASPTGRAVTRRVSPGGRHPSRRKCERTFHRRARASRARARPGRCRRYGSGTCGTDTTPSRSRIASLSARSRRRRPSRRRPSRAASAPPRTPPSEPRASCRLCSKWGVRLVATASLAERVADRPLDQRLEPAHGRLAAASRQARPSSSALAWLPSITRHSAILARVSLANRSELNCANWSSASSNRP